MEQVIFGGYDDALSTTGTEYVSLVGGWSWWGLEWSVDHPVSTDGVIKQLRIKLNGSPGAGKKYTFVLMLNGNPSALTLEIADAATSNSDMVNEVTVAGGDTVSIRCVPDGTPTARFATWTSVFEGDTANESLILGGSAFVSLDPDDTEYGHVMGAYSLLTAIEDDQRQVVPTAGTIKDLYVKLSADPGNDPEAYRFTLRKGPAEGPQASTDLTVTITADDTTGSDLVNTVDVVAGDILTLMIEPLNSPSGIPWASWGMTFVADTDGESIVLGGSAYSLDDTATEYNMITSFDTWTPDETIRYHLGQVCTVKKLYMLLNGSPGAGNKYDFTLRVGGADSNVVATVADAAITGNSAALEDTVANDDYITLKAVPTDTPTVRDAYWGFVCYAPTIVDGSVDLLGKAVTRHMGTVELLGKVDITHSVDLLGKADIQPKSAYSELFSRFLIPAIYSITGITKDKAGNRLGNCEVALFRTIADNPPTYLFIKVDVSDANGDYSFTGLIRTKYFVRAQDGSPNVFDTTDNEIVPV